MSIEIVYHQYDSYALQEVKDFPYTRHTETNNLKVEPEKLWG